MEQEKILLDRKTTASVLGGISLRTLDGLVASGELKPTRVGRRVLFRRADLERFARRDHHSTSEKN